MTLLHRFLSLGAISGVAHIQRPPQASDFGGGGPQSPIVINDLTGDAWIYVNGAITPLGEIAGNWIPVDASGAGLAFVITAAKFVKKGSLVFLGLQLTYPATANGANAMIGGLPYNIAVPAYTAIFSSVAGLDGVFAVAGPSLSLVSQHGAAVTNAQMTGALVVASIPYLTTP